MKKNLVRSIVVLAAASLLSGLLVTPARAQTPVCTPPTDPITITVAGQEVTIPGGTGRCVGPSMDQIQGALPEVSQNPDGSYTVVIKHARVNVGPICIVGVNGCLVWLELRERA